ncbi:PREDICTED: uncharacterized protein LOC108366210 [Rhagoletis zephyria]|uniref:uncharacterized protein LOC108366210 n=1 Tax=Rhagoletis zephyria TaxID=28612 RepID=UPI00081190AF|nr:PREDICTED: uncharacterized protein LOC108366210 [Rhagoletis zephyria]
MRNRREWNKVWLDYKLKQKKKLRQTDEKLWSQEENLTHNKAPLERTVDELLHLQEAVNPAGSSFGTNVEENAVSGNGIYLEEPLGEQAPQDADLIPRSSTPRPRVTVQDRDAFGSKRWNSRLKCKTHFARGFLILRRSLKKSRGI